MLQSGAARALRRLAVQLAARLAATEHGERAADLLLLAVGDEDVGVALEAERGLQQAAATPAGLSLLLGREQQRLQAMAGSADPTLRARGLTLAISLAAASPQAAVAVREAGLLQPLVGELGRADDLLSCMAALQLVGHAAQLCDSGMAAQLQEAVAPQLSGLLRHPEPLLQCAAMQAAAALVATTLQGAPASMDVECAELAAANGSAAMAEAAEDLTAVAATSASAPVGPGSSLAQALLAALKAVLDVSSSEPVPAEVEEAALDATSALSMHSVGAALLLLQPRGVIGDVAYKALGRPPSPAIRMAALHALAAVAGAERAAGGSRAAALLPGTPEDVLRAAVYAGASAASGGLTPAEAFWAQLEQPFLEQRVAAYRALSALLLRDWAAADVCSHTALLAFLTSPQSETGLQGCEWRHACVAALAATLLAVTGPAGSANGVGAFHSVLSAALPQVDAAARQGPFGQGRGAPAAHLVATLPGQ